MKYQDGRYLFARLQEQLFAGSLTRKGIVNSMAISKRRDIHSLVVMSSDKKIREDIKLEEKQKDFGHLIDKLVYWDIGDHAPTKSGRHLKAGNSLREDCGGWCKASKMVMIRIGRGRKIMFSKVEPADMEIECESKDNWMGIASGICFSRSTLVTTFHLCIDGFGVCFFSITWQQVTAKPSY